MADFQGENKENTEENEEPEIDLLDEKGHKEKLEVFEEKEEPIKKDEIITPKEKKPEPKSKEPILKKIFNFYDKEYKKLTVFTLLILLIAIIIIGVNIAKTGSFINKDVSLKGGVTLTITSSNPIEITELEKYLQSSFSKNDISVRSIHEGGKQIGTVIIADIEGTNKEELSSFITAIESGIGYKLKENDYSIEIMGSTLGASFFRETITALVIAFVLMSIVVLVYLREPVPGIIVVFCAFADIIETLAVVDLLGMRVGTGGIAAFLMLIGYAVDTNILLSVRVLKRKEGTIMDRVIGAIKTGTMMSVTAIAALIIGIIFMKSEVVRQIMTIILIGLLFDMINTWIQNVGILRYYLERKGNKNE